MIILPCRCVNCIMRRFLEEAEDMDRLKEKLGRVAGIVPRVAGELESRADFALEREKAITMRGKRIFDAKHSMLDDADRGLDSIEHELQKLTNGDPLEGSGSASEQPSEFVPTHPAPEPKAAQEVAASPAGTFPDAV
jgi:hypothetical protein